MSRPNSTPPDEEHGSGRQHSHARDLAVAQFESSTLLPAPADPATTVSPWPDPAVSRSISAGLVTKVAGSVAGRNFAKANRRLDDEPRSAIALSSMASLVPL